MHPGLGYCYILPIRHDISITSPPAVAISARDVTMTPHRSTWLLLASSMTSALMRPTPSSVRRSPRNRSQLRTRTLLSHDGWTATLDQASGQTYYYNEQTGQSQWEPPPQAAWQHPAGTNQVLWRLAGSTGIINRKDRRYNLRRHDVQVLSRYNMFKQKLTVSRKQCLVSCLADGTATLTSIGRGPTLWRERGGPWCSVQKGERLTLTDGDGIALDCNNPEGAAFECLAKRAVQQGQGGYPQGSSSYAQQRQLPYPWEQLTDQSGQAYYSNPQTGESQWDPPQHGGSQQQLF